MFLKMAWFTGTPAVIDCDIATRYPTGSSKRLHKGSNAGGLLWIGLDSAHKQSDPPHPIALLSACCDWPHCRATDKRDELTPPH
jgi:hypothetical protein